MGHWHLASNELSPRCVDTVGLARVSSWLPDEQPSGGFVLASSNALRSATAATVVSVRVPWAACSSSISLLGLGGDVITTPALRSAPVAAVVSVRVPWAACSSSISLLGLGGDVITTPALRSAPVAAVVSVRVPWAACSSSITVLGLRGDVNTGLTLASSFSSV